MSNSGISAIRSVTTGAGHLAKLKAQYCHTGSALRKRYASRKQPNSAQLSDVPGEIDGSEKNVSLVLACLGVLVGIFSFQFWLLDLNSGISQSATGTDITVPSLVIIAKRRLVVFTSRLDPSAQMLFVFGCIVLWGSATIHFWRIISITADKFYLALGLFFTMVGGMFVQVITSNYNAGASIGIWMAL